MINTTTKSNTGEKSVWLTLSVPSPSSRDARAEHKQKLKQKEWRKVTYWLSGLCSAISYTAQAHLPQDGATLSEMALPTSVKIILHRHGYLPIYWQQFFT